MKISQSTLATSGNLKQAYLLHNRLFSYQELEDGKWVDKGNLALFENTAFLNNEKLYHVHYHKPTESVHYSFGKGENHRSGRFFFSEEHLAFTGTVHSSDGTLTAVRGNLRETVFNTQRKLQSESTYTDWETFTLGTEWVGEGPNRKLKSIFKLGSQDISKRTAVVDIRQWETTINMMKDNNPLGGGRDSFTIVVDYQGHKFKGTYTDKEGIVYDWQGTVQEHSIANNIADFTSFMAIDTAPREIIHLMAFTAADRATADNGPDISVQDLMNVSSVTQVEVKGETKVLDMAQVQTGKYFQSILINSLDQKWIDDFFGDKRSFPEGVQKVMDAHQKFYKDKAVMNLGQMIHDNFGTVERDKNIVKKIDNDKLDKAWKALGKDPDYGTQSSELYIQGYKDGVPGIQPYLANDPKGWAKRLYENITSEDFVSMWAVQVASDQFKNVQHQLYEWYVQLSVLDPDPIDPNSNDPNATYATQMLYDTFPVVLGAVFNQTKWDDSLKPFLEKAIQNMQEGNTDFADEMVKNNAEEIKKTFQQMVTTFDTIEEFTDQIINAMNIWQNRNPGQAMIDAGDDIYDGIAQMFQREGRSPARRVWDNFKDVGGKIFSSLAYATGAGFLIYQIASGQDLNPIQDISLGLLATGFMVKSIDKLLATGIGKWLRTKIEGGVSKIAEFAKDLTKWFSKEGIAAETATGKLVSKVLGKNATEFFAKRLGPVLAVFGIVISAIDLYKAIKTGDVRDTVFEAVNVFFALADLVFIGFELAGFAWAGPVGLAIAVVGVIVALVQLIWNLVSPPSLPPDPVDKFVNGPLKDAGFVLA